MDNGVNGKHSSPTVKGSSSPMKKKALPKGETSYIVEEMMDKGIAKGDITMSDGTGTDNMTCIVVRLLDQTKTE